VNSDRPKPVALIIEDEWLVRVALANEFQDAGWKVLETSTGEGALALLRKQPYVDVLITDIRLTGYLSGWDVAEAVRAERADLPVIYATANAVDRSRKVSNSSFFDKPCNPAELLETCRKLLRRNRSVSGRKST
jgi:DNA-binding response OmpR family regulator